MLKELTRSTTVYLVTGYSDLRKGIEGLATVIQGSLLLDLFNKSLYLFCGRRRDRIKGLLWEGDGFLLLYKRLDSSVFRWPRNGTGAAQSNQGIQARNIVLNDQFTSSYGNVCRKSTDISVLLWYNIHIS